MTPEGFARELAAVLAAGLPEGFTASADGEMVTIEAPGGDSATTALDIEADDIGDLDVYVEAAESVLSLAQDIVSEALDTTWPAVAAGHVDLPIPGARVDGVSLRLWYGDEDAPVLTLSPVPLQS